MFRGSVKSTGYALHSPVSPSLPLPCVTVCHHISTGLYKLLVTVSMDPQHNLYNKHVILQSVLTLLTLWCRVLLEKLTGLQLVKKFPAFHGTRRFITALTSVRHLSLSWVNPFQSIYPHPTSWRSVLILSTHLRLGLSSGLFPSGFPTKTLLTLLAIKAYNGTGGKAPLILNFCTRWG